MFKRGFKIFNSESSNPVIGAVLGNISIDKDSNKFLNIPYLTESKCLIIPIQGSVTIECIKKQEKETYVLNNSNQALFIDNGVYRKLYNFSSDAILLCLSDLPFDNTEFIDKIE